MTIEIYEATERADRERVFRFRYDVHVTELGKDGPGVDHERQVVVDDGDAHATILYALDGDAMVGTARTCFGSQADLPESLRIRFNTGPAERALGASRVSATGRLMVDPAYRGRTLASLLVTRLYELAVENGTSVDYCMCSVALLRLYQHLGYRPYRSGLRPDGVHLRVPLLICVRDKQWLDASRSPFSRLLPSELDDEGETSRNLACAYGDFRTSLPPPAQNVRTLWAELADALSQTQRPRPNLFDGLSPEESNLVVSRAAVHRFQEGEVVAMGAERRAGLGVILRGRMGVGIPSDDGHHWVELFGAGDVFGEPDAPPLGRAADLVALSPCDAAFLPADIVERLERKKPALAMKLARNLMAVLRQRVDDLHRRAA